MQVFTYERHHSASARRTVDVSIYPEGESVEALRAGNALVLDDPDGVGTRSGHRASALQSESADVQLFYRATERVLARQERVGTLTVEFNHYPEVGPRHSRTR